MPISGSQVILKGRLLPLKCIRDEPIIRKFLVVVLHDKLSPNGQDTSILTS